MNNDNIYILFDELARAKVFLSTDPAAHLISFLIKVTSYLPGNYDTVRKHCTMTLAAFRPERVVRVTVPVNETDLKRHWFNLNFKQLNATGPFFESTVPYPPSFAKPNCIHVCDFLVDSND